MKSYTLRPDTVTHATHANSRNSRKLTMLTFIEPCVDVCHVHFLFFNRFSFWRLNCRLASYHALITGEAGYECEDKWKFLTRCEEADIPISPCMHVPSIICKHRNEEGGLGFHAFKNATVGGDWIIQESLTNAPWLAKVNRLISVC